MSYEPGRRLLLVGSLLLLVGLIPSLYAYRRRIWVDVSSDAEGTTLTLAGVALQRKQTFGEAFADLADDLARSIGAEPETLPQES